MKRRRHFEPAARFIAAIAGRRRQVAAQMLAALWLSWTQDGSIVDRVGIDRAILKFQRIGPFTVNTRILANRGGTTTIMAAYGVPERIPLLYRGSSEASRDGMSWTEDLESGRGFAWQADGHLFTCQFERTDFLARIHFTYDDHPGLTRDEWIMKPNGKAAPWIPPGLEHADRAAIITECGRLTKARGFETDAHDSQLRDQRRAARLAKVRARDHLHD